MKDLTKFRYISLLFLLTFFLAIVVSLISRSLLVVLRLPLAFLLLFFIVFVGILFDMVGVAVTAAKLPPLAAKASKKVFGARRAIDLVKNAPRVATFCSDIVGDIFGTLSGAMGAIIVYRLISSHGVNVSQTIMDLVVVAIIASLTVTGKGIGKMIGISRSDQIVYYCGYFLSLLKDKKNGRNNRER